MKHLGIFVVLTLVSPILAAQKAAQKAAQHVEPPATGGISGRVFLGDSRLPARMAFVTLLPAGAAEAGGAKPVVSSALVQTGLDGSFVMPNLLPGAYYVLATKLGYASPIPISYFDADHYESAPTDVKEALAAVLTPVLVVANRISRVDLVLDKGAVISGTVRFDDGEPYSQASVSLLRKDESGKWRAFAAQEGLFSFSSNSGAPTDDQGNFRLTGLPAGEYLLRTTLMLGGAEVNSPGTDSANDPDYRWDIYFGHGVRPRDAKIIKLREGEESHGNSIEIPLARLHSVSGTVLNVESGAPINRADVELHNLDDDSTCTVTTINGTNGQFHFPYVAEGEYTLKVREGADIIPGKGDQKPLRTYEDGLQPVVVKGETNGITITVKPQPLTSPEPATQ